MSDDSDLLSVSELKFATKDVVKSIVDIWEEVINWHSSFDDDFTLDKDGKSNFSLMISTAVHDPTQVVYVARKNNKIVGFLFGYIRKHSGFFKKRTIGHISDIAVIKQERRTGVGSALMKKFETEFAKRNNAEELTLYVHNLNEEGIDFYEKLGFQVKLLSMRKKI